MHISCHSGCEFRGSDHLITVMKVWEILLPGTFWSPNIPPIKQRTSSRATELLSDSIIVILFDHNLARTGMGEGCLLIAPCTPATTRLERVIWPQRPSILLRLSPCTARGGDKSEGATSHSGGGDIHVGVKT